jgi:hypothetical protein
MTHVCRQSRLPGVMLMLMLSLAAATGLAGCGSSAAVKIMPVAGDVVAYPLDKTADAID